MKIVLFGSMFLGETGLKFFRHLAKSLEVHHFIFTPSRAFAHDPARLTPASQPFLVNNGRLSADFAGLLPFLEPEFSSWQDGAEIGGSSLMEIRRALLEDRPTGAEVRDDGSIAIHDAVGVRRQVEVLKDRILEALRDDENLAPTEIGVLAPDIADYAPYIEAIFPGSGGTDELTFNLSDLPTRSEAPFPSAFAALMSLVGSRFGRSTLVSLFENPCFSPCSGKPDLADAWRDMVESLNVRWGTGREHRAAMGAADPLTGSWENAFRRLLAAYYHDEGDNPDILPGMLGGDTRAEAAGRLMRTLRILESGLRTLDRARLPLKEWTLLWEKIIDTWLKPRMDSEEDESDRLRIKGAVRDLMALDEDVDSLDDFEDRELPWSAFSALLEEMTSPSGGRKGRYLARGISCASLKPMRAIPFRRIYVLGLDEGTWPGREYLTGFDLRDSVEKAIDLSRESVDRFAFLETLFSAKDHISFFYSGRDAERGETASPASPLSELCEFLGDGWTNLLRVHPLVPYDPAALGQDPRLITSSRDALELARSLEAGLPPAPRTGGFPVLQTDEDSVDWRELSAFLRNPIAFYYRESLGLRPEYLSEEDDEDDVLEPGFLDWWQWQNQAVTAHPELLADPEALADSFMDMLKLNGAVADTPFGELSGRKRREDSVSLAEQLARLESEGLVPGEPFSLQLDPAAEENEGDTGSGGMLSVPAPTIPLEDGRTIAVTGRIPGLRLLAKGGRLDNRIWTMMDFVSGDRVKTRHLLRSWTAALIIGNMDTAARPSEFRVFRLGSHDFSARRYRFSGDPDPAGAGEQKLIADPAVTLETLIKIREESRKAPLALHHEIADALAGAEKKGDVLEVEELLRVARDKWNALVSSTDGFSSLRDCSYRSRFLSEPDFDSPVFHRVWQELYRKGGLA